MNTPSPALLRRALKIVNEIEKLDRQIHQLLIQSKATPITKIELDLDNVKEKTLSDFSEACDLKKETKTRKQVSDERNSHHSPQHEQQSFLIDDGSSEELPLSEKLEEEVSGEHEQHEESCCLF